MTRESLTPLIDELYGAAFVDEPTFRALLGKVAAAVGVVACGIKTEWTASGTMEQTWFGLPEAFERAFVAEYWREDPWTHASRRFPAGEFLLSQQTISNEELVRTRFHAELCVPFGLHDAMGACLVRDDERYVTFGMMRPAAPRGDGSREAEIGMLLVPHLTRVMHLRHEAARLKASALAAQAGLDSVPFAAFVLDPHGRIVSTNEAADRLLRERDGLRAASSYLVAATAADTSALRKAIAAALDPTIPSRREVVRVRRAKDCALGVIVIPFVPRLGERLVVLHAIDPHASSEPTERLLRTLFGLSPAECRVAVSVARGQTPGETAIELGRGIATIRTQLRSIFQKTRTTRQAELARLLASVGAYGG